MHSFYLSQLHLFELCVQVRNESNTCAVDTSYSVKVSEHTSMTELQHNSRRGVVSMSGEYHKRMPSTYGCDVTGLSAASTICLSPPVTHATAATGHWLNCSLPSQSRCRVYSEDGTPVGSTLLRHGRPNSVKSGLPSPLQRSLMVSTGICSPVPFAKEAAVIDTSPILSTYSVTSAVRECNANSASVSNDKNVSGLLRSGSKVSLNAQIDTALDDSSHNQAFTESMLADNSLVAAAEASDADTVDCSAEDAASCCDMLSVTLHSQPSAVQLSSRDTSNCLDPAPPIKPCQSSTTSLDSAVYAEHQNANESRVESELNIPRSFSKQSIISHDSGVGLADPQPFTSHCTDVDNKLGPKLNNNHLSHEGSHFTGLRQSVRQQSVRFSRNLQVSTDVRNLLSKAGVEAVIEKEKDDADKAADNVKLQCSSNHAMTSHSEHMSPVCCVSHRQSKLVPLLPISTNLLRVSCGEQYLSSAKWCVTNSAAVAASPAVSSTGPPRIKSALLTPSFKQCLNADDGTSQLRSRFRGKPVKRLQSSACSNHSPVNPLSPRHVATSGHITVPVPFDLDV